MKTNITIKSILLIVCLLLNIRGYAEGVSSVTLHVESAGTLPNLIDANEKYQITELILSGNLNGTDIRYIREMAGRDRNGYPTEGKLAILDLLNASIVEGGKSYYDSYDCYTSNDEIGFKMFERCSSLTDVIIPSSVTVIGIRAFEECSKLISVVVPNGVTTIDSWAFDGCLSLTNIDIPNSVTTIGSGAFFNCSDLTNIVIPNGVMIVEGWTFQGCSSLTDITIPNSVTTIGSSAFCDCSSLASVTLGNSVTTLENGVFTDCSNLKEIYCKNVTPPSCNSIVFAGVPSKCFLYIPKGTYNSYQMSGWEYFENIIEKIEILYHNVSTSSNDNGVVLINKQEINTRSFEDGELVTFTVQPKDGYEIEKVLLNNEDITDELINNEYSMSIHENVIMDVTFKKAYSTSVFDGEQQNVDIVFSVNTMIIQNVKQGERVCVYTINGSLYKALTAMSNTIEMVVSPNQIYLVRVGDRAYKVVSQR